MTLLHGAAEKSLRHPLWYKSAGGCLKELFTWSNTNQGKKTNFIRSWMGLDVILSLLLAAK